MGGGECSKTHTAFKEISFKKSVGSVAVVQVVPREGVLRSHISVVNLLAVFSSCAATT